MPIAFATFALGLLCYAAAGIVSCRFYPPGMEYAEERRNNRIGGALFIVGSILIAYVVLENPVFGK